MPPSSPRAPAAAPPPQNGCIPVVLVDGKEAELVSPNLFEKLSGGRGARVCAREGAAGCAWLLLVRLVGRLEAACCSVWARGRAVLAARAAAIK